MNYFYVCKQTLIISLFSIGMSQKREYKEKLMSRHDRYNSASSSSRSTKSPSSPSPLSSPSKYGNNESTPPRSDRRSADYSSSAGVSWHVDPSNSFWKRDDKPKPGFIKRVFKPAEPSYQRLAESKVDDSDSPVRRRVSVTANNSSEAAVKKEAPKQEMWLEGNSHLGEK